MGVRYNQTTKMPSLLVYGGSGQLGDAIINCFKSQGYDTFSVDFRESPNATTSICLTGEVQADLDKVAEALTSANAKLDVVVCAAGGWVGGDIKSKDIMATVDKMYRFNVQSAVASSHIASHFLVPGGLLVLTGAAAAAGGLPENAIVAGIAPVILDTATNRQGMPNANFNDWTPLSTVAELIHKWATNDRPANGTLVKIETKNKETRTEAI